ncbi:MAG: aminoglycoside phosphotransferase family protein [Bacilli bacterium]|nr:aminoglycoside phosphotransferase family protein [Bacilli bacterium]MDY0063840.1 aminoglycoside phosphotransferase family protein [Bacilli bacterium]
MIMYNILSNFKIDGSIIQADDYGNGHINKTYLVTTTSNKKYILQQINTTVFKKPKDVMENIEMVTAHIRENQKNNPDVSRSALEIVNTHDEKTYVKIKDSYWRCYKFIEGAKTYEKITNPFLFYEVGKAVGKFQKQLQDFPIDKLNITIPNFHNTPARFNRFLTVATEDVMDRGLDIFNEIKFICDRQEEMKIIENGMANQSIPIRVTHNDTKLNNVMIDESTNQAICIIDLDTVMPGSVLYDFGDAIRIGASTAAEDEKDLEKVHLDLTLFELFTKGFLEVVRNDLKEEELNNLVLSAKIITLECGMRFLTDYLEGDVYFRTSYPDHNLIRARTQFKLVQEIEENWEQMNQIVNRILKTL